MCFVGISAVIDVVMSSSHDKSSTAVFRWTMRLSMFGGTTASRQAGSSVPSGTNDVG